MIKTTIISLLSVLFMPCFGQDDPVLIQIDEHPVHVSEFSYIYEKNNRDKADYSKESMKEYLDLYTNFKLKVYKAKEEGYHLQQSYIDELSGYRRQLAEGYVFDREIVDYLVEQMLERKKYDLGISHILISAPRNATAEKIDEARARIQVIGGLLEQGKDFEDLAKEVSEDVSSATYGGDVGYISSPLPDGYIELEDAAYALDAGQVSGVVRTDLGFHILKVRDKRPARGMMRARHILVRNEKRGIPLAGGELRIRQIHRKLMTEDVRFEDLAKAESDDLKTASSGGDLGFFGIGQYERTFEDAAFSLEEDGGISTPVQTSIGWHIIQRVSKRAPDSEAKVRNQIKSQVGKSLRIQKRIDEIVSEIQKEAKFQAFDSALKVFIDSTDEQFLKYDWSAPDFGEAILIQYGEEKHELGAFADYCRSKARERIKSVSRDLETVITELYEDFIEDKAFDYAENRLELRYPAFRNLMREYEEGILLFEITKDKVWDRASSDTTGLRMYFNENRDRYHWRERIELKTYTIDTADKLMVGTFYSDLQRMNDKALSEKYEALDIEITTSTERWETGSDAIKGIPAKEGHITKPVIEHDIGRTRVKKVVAIIPPSPKSLKEARGYIVSDYQDQLEKDWIMKLQGEYEVEVDDEVLNALVNSSKNQ